MLLQHRPITLPANLLLLQLGFSAVAMSLGFYHTCAIPVGGGLKCWGLNSDGQLGIGSTSNQLSPVDVPGVTSKPLFLLSVSPHPAYLSLSIFLSVFPHPAYFSLSMFLITPSFRSVCSSLFKLIHIISVCTHQPLLAVLSLLFLMCSLGTVPPIPSHRNSQVLVSTISLQCPQCFCSSSWISAGCPSAPPPQVASHPPLIPSIPIPCE